MKNKIEYSSDTIKLLRECDAGIKMAIFSLDDVKDNTQNKELTQILAESKTQHEKLKTEIENLLEKMEVDDKEPASMAKAMSWLKTTMKTNMNPSDEVVADLLTDGCNMGIKSLHRYMNKYKTANLEAHQICVKLINLEENLTQSMTKYL